MSPQAGDDPASPVLSRSGGLANVFRGLTASRSSRSLPLSSSSSSVALPVADIVNATPTTSTRLSPNTMDSFEHLKNGSLNERISAANTLKYAISEYPLNPVLDIWYAAKDLIDPSKPSAARSAGWELLTECVKHTSSTELERKEYFQTLAAPANSDDFHLQLAALVDLTQHGRVLDGFEYDLLPLITRWLQESYDSLRAARKQASITPRGSRTSTRNRAAVTGEEKNLAQLFAFVIDVIKFSFKTADDNATAGLIDVLLGICTSTSVEDDIRFCISVLDTVVTFGFIPDEKLKNCVQVLSSIYCLVSGLQKDSWRTLSNLCKSHNGQATVRILLDVLRGLTAESFKEKDMTREIRGSLSVLQKLLSKSSEKGYPSVSYALLVDGLSVTVKEASSTRVCAAILSVINTLFRDVDGQLSRLIVEEDWSVVLKVATECSKKLSSEPDKIRNRSEDPVGRELLLLIGRLETVLSQKSADFVPRETVIKFFINVYRVLPDSTACAVLDYFQEFRCCSPSDLQWEENLDLVLNNFFSNRERSSETRLRALRIIMDAYEILDLVADDTEQNSISNLAKAVLRDVLQETDVVVLKAVMSLMVSITASCDEELFDYIVGTLKQIVDNDRLKSPITAGTFSKALPHFGTENPHIPDQSPSNVITKGYVKMFIQAMNTYSAKSVKIYTALVHIARSSHCEVDARLTAMKLLFRLRANWANHIFVTKDLETNFLAAIIRRTEGPFAKKKADEATHTLRTSRSDHGGLSRTSRGVSFSQGSVLDRSLPVRSASGVKPPLVGHFRQMWKLPDPEALSDSVPSLISPVLVSHFVEEDKNVEIERAASKPTPCALNMPEWLEAVLGILKGGDWEVYSFVLVHLPSQLSNHAIFKDAIPQIQELRKLICEQVRMNSFQEPPNQAGLRRADVAICLFHSLTMILSYHEHFQKGEEDDIVKTFVHGITAWERTAQCCIHALSICCHELPLSATKSLGQMLNQMAAIITQPNVAIHILEFLACLSRLGDVYINFREEEYRTVLGICFRYLEYARDKRQQASRGAHTSEPSTPATAHAGSLELAHPSASDDLPQYVYALAYHVILFWFLAMKLPDRANHVGPIARRLFTDVDGSGNMSEEQALTTIDFMQRATYADIDESAEDPLFNEQRFGEMATKRWVIGNSLVTIKQSISTGWAQITKRQPSGTSTYMVREAFRSPPTHQIKNHADIRGDNHSTATIMLPSHILLQLMSSIPQSQDRPIPLPDDDATDRMIRVFDRNPTVDGHKVGVIYIGEGQTEELEILANVSGSRDYLQFLNNLGTLTRLKGATFNTQGLDREFDIDGQFTFAWRDRLTEIVFHVTTQMPTDLERDPQLANKKRHIGNDFVNIIFNDSGLPFKFDTFPSQFNYVNIVITPASRASFVATREGMLGGKEQPFYRVQVMSKPGFPEISPASETKMISLKALPAFIRLVAFNASVFSLVWQSRTGGEHVSAWRARLREIKRLREKYGIKTPLHHQGSSPSPPPLSAGAMSGAVTQQQQAEASRPSSSVRDSFTSLRRTSVATFFTSASEQTSHRSSMLSGSAGTNDTEVGQIPHASDALVDSVDFSKWA